MRFRYKIYTVLRSIADGLRLHPMRTLRHILIFNPFARKTWLNLSLSNHGENFLRDFLEACGEADVSPFLMWGTLLGCVREGGFLKHDYDIDLGILARDWPKRSPLIEAMRRRGYGLELSGNYKMRFIGPDLLAHLDVDVFILWGGKMVCCHYHESGMDGAWFPPDAFNNFRSLTFAGTRVSIPDPPERVLETAYGDWRTPVTKHESWCIPNGLHIADGETWPKLTDECT
jgi:hypothetical protein